MEKKEEYNPEEEVVAEGNYKIIDLPEVEVTTGEENDENLFECTVKLYRFDNGQWKERAVGVFKFLKNTTDGKVRAILRQETTNKIMANFYGTYPFILLKSLKFGPCALF